MFGKNKTQTINYTPSKDSIQNLLVHDNIILPQTYETDTDVDSWFYSFCNTRPRLSKSLSKRLWLQPIIKAKDLDFYIFQALMLSVTKVHYTKFISQNLFDEIQRSYPEEASCQNVLLNPEWKAHESYILSKIHNPQKKCFYTNEVEVNEIILLPEPMMVGVLGGHESSYKSNQEAFNIYINNMGPIHHINISRMLTVDKYFENLMNEALE